MSNTNQATSTASVQADPASVLRLLAATFSSSTTVLAELMQNGRRAGATELKIEATETELSIYDDGCGIEDPSILLSVATSGWDEAIQAAESPYGAGWVSALFACERIVVESQGKRMSGVTKDLIDLKPALVEAIEKTEGTTIRLIGQRLGKLQTIRSAVADYASGFPIPVSLNGEAVARPYAVDAQPFVQTEVGLVNQEALCDTGLTLRLFLQGLPISTGYRYHGTGVLHLDSTKFRGRMPDRAQVIDSDKAAKHLKEVLDEERRKFLTQQCAKLGAEAFLIKHGEHARGLGMFQLLDSLDLTLCRWLPQFAEHPHQEPSGGGIEVEWEGVVTREKAEADGLYCVDYHDDDLLAAHVVHQVRGRLVRTNADNYWATRGKVLASEDFTVVMGDLLGEDRLSVDYAYARVRVVKSIVASGPLGEVAIPFHMDDGFLYVTPSSDPFYGVMQVSSFEFEEGSVDEDARRDAADALAALVASIVTPDPAELLRALMTSQMSSRPNGIKSKSFRVDIDEDGTFAVSLI